MTYLDLLLSGLFRGCATVLPIDAAALLLTAPTTVADQAVGYVLTSAFAAGSVLAVLVTLSSDVAALGRGAWRAALRRPDASSRLLALLAMASLPSLIVDLGLSGLMPPITPLASAILVLITGVILGAADHLGVTVRDVDHLSTGHFAALGLVRAVFGLIGLSSQDMVIVMARLMGCERDQAAKVSLLLLVIPLLSQSLVAGHAAFTVPVSAPTLDIVVIGLSSLIASTLSISFLLTWLKRRTFLIFALAHLAIGGWLLFRLF